MKHDINGSMVWILVEKTLPSHNWNSNTQNNNQRRSYK